MDGSQVENSLEVLELSPSARLDAWLSPRLAGASRSQVQAAIRAGRVRCNGEQRPAAWKLRLGDVVELAPDIQETLQPAAASPAAVDTARKAAELAIVHEDEDLLVINKPAGLTVHPGAGTAPGSTLSEWLQARGTPLSQAGGEDRPGIVHRIDRDTSGLIVCAKHDAAHEQLSAQFRDKSCQRHYVALVDGCPKALQWEHEAWLARDPRSRTRYRAYASAQNPAARWAKTHFTRLASYGERLALLRCQLATGRTHQIRCQLQAQGLPVIGDPVYGRPVQLPQQFPPHVAQQLNQLGRQFLHAYRLELTHPRLGKPMSFSAPLTAELASLLRCLEALQ